MTAGAEQVLGNDRVCSETVGLGIAQVELGHQQCVASHLQTDRSSSFREHERVCKLRDVIGIDD